MAGLILPTQYTTIGGADPSAVTPDIADLLARAQMLQKGGSSTAPIYGSTGMAIAQGLARLAQGALGGYLSGQGTQEAADNQKSIAETLARAATAGKGWVSPDTFQGNQGQTIQAGSVAPGTGGRASMAAVLASNPLTADRGAELGIDAQKTAEDQANRERELGLQQKGQMALETQREGSAYALAKLQQSAPTSLSRDLAAAGIKPGTPEYTDAVSSYYGKSLPTLPTGYMWGTDASGARVAKPITDDKGQPLIGGDPNDLTSAAASWGLNTQQQKQLFDTHQTLQKQAEGIRSLYTLRSMSDKTPSGMLGGAEATVDALAPQGTDMAARANAAQEWDKIANDVVTSGLRDAFGGRITNLELSNQLKKFPSVTMRQDGRNQMLDQIIGKAERAYQENYAQAQALSRGRYAQLYKPGVASGNATALQPGQSPPTGTGNTGGPGIPGIPGAAPATDLPTNLPDQARAQLKQGQTTTFANGQIWTLDPQGNPKRVQ